MPEDDPFSDEECELASAEEEAERLREEEPPPKISETEFLSWRSPRQVDSNPTRLENPLWNWLVRTRLNAYQANALYAGPSSYEAGPMWTFDRFGKNETILADGRVVHISGGHEDFYDLDFFIYNDVTVIDEAGKIAIYGYPQEDFPPTDFHSATLVANEIYVIGRLGYCGTRVLNVTPVYKLSLGSMRIEAVETRGTPPGWIYGHTASLSDDGHTIIVSGGERWLGEERSTFTNVDSWAFDTQSSEWCRISERGWQQWVMRRVDRKQNRLWEIRQALWNRDLAHRGFKSDWSYDDEPDFAALDKLYRLDDESHPVIKEPEFSTFHVVLDGVNIRFIENSSWVEAIVEGQLTPKRLSDLQQTTLALLERIDSAQYEIEDVDSVIRRA